ncbi:MAG: hypothetical protein ACN4G0_04160 [Polyangiales bacterium]
MIRRMLKLVWTGVVLAFVAYILFFTRLGDRTPFQHLMRVAGTDEAKELGREVTEATGRITKKIGDQVHEATKPPKGDAGTGEAPASVTDRINDLVGEAQEREERIEAARIEAARIEQVE